MPKSFCIKLHEFEYNMLILTNHEHFENIKKGIIIIKILNL
jgi:hypothetical protein